MRKDEEVAALTIATLRLGRCLLWVKNRQKTMSAVTAAFAESGHGGRRERIPLRLGQCQPPIILRLGPAQPQ